MIKRHNSGSAFFAIFAAVAMVGLVGVSLNTVMRGTVTSMSNVTKRNISDNNMIASGRLAIMASSTQQPTGGDCDADAYVEPMPYRDAGAGPKPTGGGYLPNTLGASQKDPWQTDYGYCVWDHGPQSVANAIPGCGGASPRRLQGANNSSNILLAVISAGADRVFQTSCNAYVDVNADNIADTPLVNKPAGSDDMFLAYTYAEANSLGGEIWNIKTTDSTVAEIAKNLEVKNSGGNVVFGVDSTSDPVKPSIKVDYVQKLTPANAGVEFLSNMLLGNNYLSHSTGTNGLRVTSGGGISSSGTDATLSLYPRDGTGDHWSIYNPTGDNLHFWRSSNGDRVTFGDGGGVSATGHFTSTNTSPSIYLRDTDERSAILHTNTNLFHILSSGVNSLTSELHGSNWPLTIDLATDAVRLGGDLTVQEGNVYIPTGALSANPTSGNAVTGISPNSYGVYGQSGTTYGVYGKSLAAGQGGVLGYDAQGSIYGILGYANAFSFYGNGQAYIAGVTQIAGTAYMPFIYDNSNTNYYLNPDGSSQMEDVRVGVLYDRYNTGYYVVPRSLSIMEQINIGYLYDRYDSNYYLIPRVQSVLHTIYSFAYNSASDRRMKKNIVPITQERLNKLYDVEGVDYDWIESGKHNSGVIAQDVQKLFPEFVTENKEGNLGVNYNSFIGLLIESAKEQKSEIETLKEELRLLREEMRKSQKNSTEYNQ